MSLVLPDIYSIQFNSCFARGSTQSSSGYSRACLSGWLLALFGALVWRVLGALWRACFTPSSLGRSYSMGDLKGLVNHSLPALLLVTGCVSSPSSLYWIFNNCLAWSRLSQNSAWLVFPVVAVWIPSDFHTGSIGQKFCLGPFIIIFDWILCLVILLLCVGGSEEINHHLVGVFLTCQNLVWS